ncbi:hypothetical protein ACLOJK_038131 [Asimina triloba]
MRHKRLLKDVDFGLVEKKVFMEGKRNGDNGFLGIRETEGLVREKRIENGKWRESDMW